MGAFSNSSVPNLDFRGEGIHLEFNAGQTSTEYYNFSHTPQEGKVSFYGVALYSPNSESGDNLDMWTEYSVDSGVTWKKYKKFAKNFNIFPRIEMKDIIFPTTPTNIFRIAFTYRSKGISKVDLFVNLYNFVDQQLVDPTQGQEGRDW